MKELDKQIYPEGDKTWGCKSGWLDVEDVKDSIRELKEKLTHKFDCNEEINDLIIRVIDSVIGEKLIK